MSSEPLRLIIHAADDASLARARSNAANFVAAASDAQVEIVINADAVAAAIDKPHATDPYLRVCANTLANKNIAAPDKLKQVPAAVVYIAQRQRDGWAYMRA
jgi:NitT/TauT family transport system ATP-binding protein